MAADVALTMTDEYPYAFAQVIISAVPLPASPG
jgi:holo-[acyl-carrier protein] synthase